MNSTSKTILTIGWWKGLEDQWKKAFNASFFNKGSIVDTPNEKELQELGESAVIRIAGPGAPYPNLGFELSNLSGIKKLYHLETLIVTHHQIKDVFPLEKLEKLKSVFLNNNHIGSLVGMEKLDKLTELYIQDNMIQDIEPISKLKSLLLLNCVANRISELPLPPHLKELYCLPNENMTDREILRIENRLGIRCRRA